MISKIKVITLLLLTFFQLSLYSLEKHILYSDIINRWGFQEFCDFRYIPTADGFFEHKIYTFNPQEIQRGSTVFVNSSFVKDFFEKIHPKIKYPYILITHVYDWDMPGSFLKYLDDPKLHAWFTINPSLYEHPKLFPIPIGILQQPFVNTQKYKIKRTINRIKQTSVKKNLLYMNFNFNNLAERYQIYNMFNNKHFCFKSDSNKQFDDYLKEMAQSKFVLSPRGGGLDCYRTWEALLVGSIPIVKHSNLDCLYKDLPILIIDSWEDITEEFLNTKYKEIISKNYKIEKLFMGYWLKQILQQKASTTNL